MNFFKKLLGIEPAPIDCPKLPERYPENAQGDFYVENQVCITCGAPEAEAPDLIDHSKIEYGHCYFKKQPQTPDELNRAINAMQVSCIAGLRYGGKDEEILKRLYEEGLADECDHKPAGKYKMIVRNKVQFHYTRSFREFADELTFSLLATKDFANKQIFDFNTNDINYFRFVYRWTNGLTGIIIECTLDDNDLFKIKLRTEKDVYLVSLRNFSSYLHTIFIKNTSIKDILWFDLDGNTYDKDQNYLPLK